MARSVVVRCCVVAWTFALVLGGASPSMSDKGDCGQPKSVGRKPNTADCLYVLKVAVGAPPGLCSPECICDTNSDGKVSTFDALRCLLVVVGISSKPLDCDCPEPTTTSTTTTLPPPCADISGGWSSSGSGNYSCTIDGETDSGQSSGFGFGFVSQNQCNASFSVSDEVFDISLYFHGPVTFTTYDFSGEWFPEDDYDVYCSKNFFKGHGVINASADRIDYTYSGAFTCSGNGHAFSCTASGTERWTR